MAARPAKPARRWPFALFLLFVLGYNLFRVALFAMTQTGAVQPEHPLDPLANAAVVYSELAIGIVGLLAIPGLVGSRPWGFWLTAGVNVYAIVFDAVSAVAVQLSAAGGVIPPMVILAVIIAMRHRFFRTHPETAPAPAAQA